MTGDAIKALRMALDMTQQQFAEAVGVSLANVSRWENGHVKPSRLAINKMKSLQKRKTA